MIDHNGLENLHLKAMKQIYFTKLLRDHNHFLFSQLKCLRISRLIPSKLLFLMTAKTVSYTPYKNCLRQGDIFVYLESEMRESHPSCFPLNRIKQF